MEVQCLKVRIKAGCTDHVIDWMKSLQDNMDLVYEALAAEMMVVESVFLERGEDADYLIFYTRAESLQKSNEVMIKSTNPVDVEALKMMQQTWEDIKSLEVLFDVDRIDLRDFDSRVKDHLAEYKKHVLKIPKIK